MKIIFAGTPLFARLHLEALLKSEHEICAVLTQPDRPQGRGQILMPSPVKQLALSHHIPVFSPKSLKKPDALATLGAFHPEVWIVVAYGLLLPQAALDLPAYGCLNVHASLLPRWRGASPIQQALLAGDAVTGVTLMQMTLGLDEGPMLAQTSISLSEEDTAQTVHDRLAAVGTSTLLEVLKDLPHYLKKAQPQPSAGASYAPKIQKTDAKLDWGQSASALAQQIQAFNPWPVAYAPLSNTIIRFLKSTAKPEVQHHEKRGTILSASPEGLLIACGSGALLATEIQLPNKKAMPVGSFLHGHTHLLKSGQVFE